MSMPQAQALVTKQITDLEATGGAVVRITQVLEQAVNALGALEQQGFRPERATSTRMLAAEALREHVKTSSRIDSLITGLRELRGT